MFTTKLYFQLSLMTILLRWLKKCSMNCMNYFMFSFIFFVYSPIRSSSCIYTHIYYQNKQNEQNMTVNENLKKQNYFRTGHL